MDIRAHLKILKDSPYVRVNHGKQDFYGFMHKTQLRMYETDKEEIFSFWSEVNEQDLYKNLKVNLTLARTQRRIFVFGKFEFLEGEILIRIQSPTIIVENGEQFLNTIAEIPFNEKGDYFLKVCKKYGCICKEPDTAVDASPDTASVVVLFPTLKIMFLNFVKEL